MKKTLTLSFLMLLMAPFIGAQLMAQCNCQLQIVRTNVNCHGDCSGSATATASNGSGPYTYLWSDGQVGATASNLCAGIYTVTATDANGCTVAKSVTISQKPVINSVQIVTPMSCNGVCDGTDSVAVTGGMPPYQFLWNTGETTQAISGLCEGIYTVTITDALGCVKVCVGHNAVVEPGPVVVVESGSDVLCNGDCNGVASAVASGGFAPYNYLWSNGETSDEINGLCANTYTVTATDDHGCSGSAVVVIGEPAAVNVNVDVVVAGAPGSLTANPSGGTAPYTYLWSNGQTTASISGLAAGTYTVTVTDVNGCQDQATGCITGNCGGFRSQTMGGWGAKPHGNNPASYLHANFVAAFPQGITVGCNKTLKLTTAQAVTDFLPSGSTAKALVNNLVNPGGSYDNVLAGQVVALAISIGFDNYDAGFGASGTPLSGQIINSGTFAGWTVQQAFVEANNKLGGCASPYSFSQLNNVISNINENYVDGSVNNGFLSCPGVAKIADQAVAEKLALYPNPSRGTISVTLTQEAGEAGMINIYNHTGAVVKSFIVENSNGQLQYELGDLNAGIYNMVYKSNIKTMTAKVILTH